MSRVYSIPVLYCALSLISCSGEYLQAAEAVLNSKEYDLISFNETTFLDKIKSSNPDFYTNLRHLGINNDAVILDRKKLNLSLIPAGNVLKKMTSLEGIQYFVNLENLIIDYHDIRSLEPLSNLTKLKEIRAEYNRIRSLKGIRNLERLTKLAISNKDKRDYLGVSFSQVQSLEKLTFLKLINLGLDEIPDLSKLSNLSTLDLLHNKIKDLSPIKNNFNLKRLCVEDNKISDLTPLVSLLNLEMIWLEKNKINLKKQDVFVKKKSRQVEQTKYGEFDEYLNFSDKPKSSKLKKLKKLRDKIR